MTPANEYKRRDWLTKLVALTGPAPPVEPAPAADAIVVSETDTAPAPAPEPVAAAAAEPGPPAEQGHAAAPTPKKSLFAGKRAAAGAQQRLEAAVTEAMAHLEAEKLPDLAAELGVDAAELATLVQELPADFQQLVAAEAAKITAG